MTTVHQENPTASMKRDLVAAAQDQAPITGLTHNFYRHPARFSPPFVAAAIQCFTRPGDLVLDPFVGGGTTVIEAMVAGRRTVGSDLNSLSVFVTRVKTSILRRAESDALEEWATNTVPTFSYFQIDGQVEKHLRDRRVFNLHHNRGRYIKKVIAVALASLDALPSIKASDFARCAILRAGKIALDGRTRSTPVGEFREILTTAVLEMLEGSKAFAKRATSRQRTLIEGCATTLPRMPIFAKRGERADLVVTSPPYPGIHVLYHRWQLDGRRETPAPYWIAGCEDGEMGSYYTFGDRKSANHGTYFAKARQTMRSVRTVMRHGARIVQMIAFSNPRPQLPRYLRIMEKAGFSEEPILGYSASGAIKRIRRNVPGRRWHANLQGNTSSSREVVLVHRAT